VKHTVKFTHDVYSEENVLAGQEEATVELDSTVDSPEVWDHFWNKGVFAGQPGWLETPPAVEEFAASADPT
jgi:hypothetical protein